jgi:hypothetical protein
VAFSENPATADSISNAGSAPSRNSLGRSHDSHPTFLRNQRSSSVLHTTRRALSESHDIMAPAASDKVVRCQLPLMPSNVPTRSLVTTTLVRIRITG